MANKAECYFFIKNYKGFFTNVEMAQKTASMSGFSKFIKLKRIFKIWEKWHLLQILWLFMQKSFEMAQKFSD